MSQAYAAIASVLTPAGRGAIATIRVTGTAAVAVVSGLLQTDGQPPLAVRPLRTIVFGRWSDSQGEELVASCVAADRVEIHCHGGVAAVARIVEDLRRCGCQVVSWPEAAQLACDFAPPGNWRQAALVALAAARTERTAGILLDQYGGAGDAALHEILSRLDVGDAANATKLIDDLLTRAPLGLHLVHPWSVVLAGRPNVGKSSLINALLGYRRAIVFDTPGTTRDIVTATTACDGWPIELSDTAGWRDTAGDLESQGIAAAKAAASHADLVLLVADHSQGWTDEDETLAAACPHALLVWNKMDLPPHATTMERPGVVVSALANLGINDLLAQIAQRLVPCPPARGAAVPFTPLQVESLASARQALKHGEMEQARLELQQIK